MNLPAERDLTLIFERDDIADVVARHCRHGHGVAGRRHCESCLQLIGLLAFAISEWRALVDQDRSAPLDAGVRP